MTHSEQTSNSDQCRPHKNGAKLMWSRTLCSPISIRTPVALSVFWSSIDILTSKGKGLRNNNFKAQQRTACKCRILIQKGTSHPTFYGNIIHIKYINLKIKSSIKSLCPVKQIHPQRLQVRPYCLEIVLKLTFTSFLAQIYE